MRLQGVRRASVGRAYGQLAGVELHRNRGHTVTRSILAQLRDLEQQISDAPICSALSESLLAQRAATLQGAQRRTLRSPTDERR